MSSTYSMLREEQRWTRLSLLAGFVLALFFVCIILLRYPGNDLTASRYLELGLGTIVIELILCAWVVFWGTRPRTVRGSLVLQQGMQVGVLCGILWILEISFNNIVPPQISTPMARFYIDNGFWLAIMLIILAVAAKSAYQQRSMLAGIQVGAWSGLVSGLLACLMGSLLVAFFLNLIMRDPLMIQEFAERGPASGAPDIARYVAYETLTGSVGHLTILGPVMGSLLGLLGSPIGRSIGLLRREMK
ncbi:MAG: hypothetical protein NVS2B12_18550 [Ktedonobacteraceae bacterium]